MVVDAGSAAGDGKAEDKRLKRGWSVRSLSSVSCIWLDQTNQIDQMNQTDEIAFFLGRMDQAVGRQGRASHVGGEQRLNLAAQFVLNFIG